MDPPRRRPVVPAPVYRVIGEILAFTFQVDEALNEEPAPASEEVVAPAEEDS